MARESTAAAVRRLIEDGHSPAEIIEAAKRASTALPAWRVGEAPKGAARAAAVRQLVADVAEPVRLMKPKPASVRAPKADGDARERARRRIVGVLSGWIIQRANELGLARDRVDRDRTLFERLVSAPTLNAESVTVEALVAVGVRRRDAHNWVDGAMRAGKVAKVDQNATGRVANVRREGRRISVSLKR